MTFFQSVNTEASRPGISPSVGQGHCLKLLPCSWYDHTLHATPLLSPDPAMHPHLSRLHLLPPVHLSCRPREAVHVEMYWVSLGGCDVSTVSSVNRYSIIGTQRHLSYLRTVGLSFMLHERDGYWWGFKPNMKNTRTEAPRHWKHVKQIKITLRSVDLQTILTSRISNPCFCLHLDM